MKKEILTVENIKSDLMKVAKVQQSIRSEAREIYIIPPILLAIAFGFYTKTFWIALPFLAFAAFHIIKYIREHRQSSDAKRRISDSLERGDFSVSVEKLSHIANETVYEPHAGRRRAHSTREAVLLYFLSGASWRVPTVEKHYEWSENYYMSSAGILNTSVKDNEFYFITLKGYPNISYVYNTKMFELSENANHIG